MIAFSRLGGMGRLGNQMFQYAFLRSAALQLGTRFFCPAWEGDEIFRLDDAESRARTPDEHLDSWHAPAGETGWIEGWSPKDQVDYAGYFISPRFFASAAAVRRWFSFQDWVTERAAEWLRRVNFSESVGMHVRMGDFRNLSNFYLPRQSYYTHALERLSGGKLKSVVVFSDDPRRARAMLAPVAKDIQLIEGNDPAIDLYLMTQCRGFIVAASTFSWWGAFLGGRDVVCPKQGLFRPGAELRADACWPDEWIKIDAGLHWYDHHRVRACGSVVKRMLRNVSNRSRPRQP